MPKTRAPYPAEFGEEMVRLVRAGRSPGELSREFEPSDQTIRNWVNQADVDEGRREGLATSQLEELRRLRRENRILREEGKRSWQRQRPGSPSRSRVHPEAAFGFVKANQVGYSVRRMCGLLCVLGQRLLRMPEPWPIGPGAGRPGTAGPDSGYPCSVPGHLWGASCPRRAGCRGCGRWSQTGGPAHATGPHLPGGSPPPQGLDYQTKPRPGCGT